MKAYILGYGNQWQVVKDPERILNTDENCVIAQTVDEALEIINRNYNPYGPDFIVAYKQEYRGYDEPTIYSLKDPVLREDMTFFEALDIMEKTGEEVSIRSWQQRNEWRDEIEPKHFTDFGVYWDGYKFKYDPKKAERYAKQINGTYKPLARRKNFIRAYSLVRLKRGLNDEFRSAVWDNYGFNDNSLGITVRTVNGDERKEFISQYIMMSFPPFNTWFGEGSYRKTRAFQEFKALWKRERPKSAKATGVSQELFDFMEKEIKIRRPRNMKFKGKKVLYNDKSRNV